MEGSSDTILSRNEKRECISGIGAKGSSLGWTFGVISRSSGSEVKRGMSGEDGRDSGAVLNSDAARPGSIKQGERGLIVVT